jgi:hypothetical protein
MFMGAALVTALAVTAFVAQLPVPAVMAPVLGAGALLLSLWLGGKACST